MKGIFPVESSKPIWICQWSIYIYIYICMYVCIYVYYVYMNMTPTKSLNGTLAVDSPFQKVAVDFSSNV